MSQTKEGGQRTKQTIIDKYGPDYYQKIGKMGGSVKSPTKGFGSMSKEKIREAGAKGGRNSRKGAVLVPVTEPPVKFSFRRFFGL